MREGLTILRECRRLLQDRYCRIALLIIIAVSLRFCLYSNGRTATDAFIVEPAKSAASFSVLIFVLLTLLLFHRDFRNRTDSILFSYVNPVYQQIRRTIGLAFLTWLASAIIAAIAYPIAVYRLGDYLKNEDFLVAWFGIFWPATLFAVLLTAGFYLLFRRVEVAFIFVAAMIVGANFLENQFTLNPSYMWFWVKTSAGNFSDVVSNTFLIDLIWWNRLFGSLCALALWFVGLLSVRRYGYALLGSWCVNAKGVWLPLSLLITVIGAVSAFRYEPYFDRSAPINMGPVISSGTGIVTSVQVTPKPVEPTFRLLKQTTDVTIDTRKRQVQGVSKYELQNLKSTSQSLSFDLGTGYEITQATVNGVVAPVTRSDKEEMGRVTWTLEATAAEVLEVELQYRGRVKNNGALSQRPTFGISEGFVWLSSVGFAPLVKAELNPQSKIGGVFALPEKLFPLLTNTTPEKLETANGITKWKFELQGGRGTGLSAADYSSTKFKAGGLDVNFVHFSKHGQEVEKLKAVEVMKASIDYFTKAYGPLPYKDHLVMLELPASFSGGFASGNTSAMDETSFASEGFLPQSEYATPDGGSGIETLVHEIAHQWWGLATMPVPDEGSLWTAEGITCYSTYRFMDEYYGAEFAKTRYLDVWEKGRQRHESAFYIRNPQYLKMLSATDAANVLAGLRSMAIYEVMPLQLLKAEEACGGKEAFQKKLSQLYQGHIRQPVTYADFLSVVGLKPEDLQLEK